MIFSGSDRTAKIMPKKTKVETLYFDTGHYPKKSSEVSENLEVLYRFAIGLIQILSDVLSVQKTAPLNFCTPPDQVHIVSCQWRIGIISRQTKFFVYLRKSGFSVTY